MTLEMNISIQAFLITFMTIEDYFFPKIIKNNRKKLN